MQQEMLLMASRMLSYPDEQAEDEWELMQEMIGEMDVDAGLQEKLYEAVSDIYSLSLGERKRTYVATFDLKKKHALYLSAHEFGDSPKRGAALIRLQKIVNEAGYEREDGELADFIPMLMELCAVADSSPDIDRLLTRLGYAVHEIHTHMPEDNPYRGVLNVLMNSVFTAPSEKEMEAARRDREEADLEELPYPLLYQ